jgi:hypothetical protein
MTPSSGEPEFVTTNGKERTADDACIVSCGIGPEYQEALHSTRLHCEVNVPEAWRLFYRELPLGCPPHHLRQYAFKIYAIERAIAAGFRYVLWMDTAFQPVRSIEPLWDLIRARGWYAPPQGNSTLGEWCNDAFCSTVGRTRDQLMEIPLVYSGLVGFDINSVLGFRMWRHWKYLYDLGTFDGPHLNADVDGMHPWGLKFQGRCSADPRVFGHRHDEAALSFVIAAWDQRPTNEGFLTIENPDGFIGHHVKLRTP